MQYIREIELEIVDQMQIPRYVSRFEPLLYVPAFTQKNFYYYTRTFHKGTSTEELQFYTWSTLLLSQSQSPLHKRDMHKAKTQSPLHKRDKGTKPKSITITSTQKG